MPFLRAFKKKKYFDYMRSTRPKKLGIIDNKPASFLVIESGYGPTHQSLNERPLYLDVKEKYPNLCPDCYSYYSRLGLSEDDLRKRISASSKHGCRQIDKSYSEPEHFWETEFPSDDECRKRGYI